MQAESTDELDQLVQAVDERQPLFIGISGKKQSGKDSVALMLNMLLTDVDDNQSAVMICAFANQLKAIARDLFYWDGQKDDGGRWLLQRLGTEIVMGRYGLDFWVKRLHARIKDELSHLVTMPRIVAITDVRFPFEVDYVKEKGGEVWRVERDMPDSGDQHLSEIALDGETRWDAMLKADSLDGLFEQIKEQVTRLQEKGLI